MKTNLLLIVALLAGTATADEYKILSHEYNLLFQQTLHAKIRKLPKQCLIQVTFKHQPTETFRYAGYSEYDDALWVGPIKKARGLAALFSKHAYSIQELQDVEVIDSDLKEEPI
jgi:hypothetical protein